MSNQITVVGNVVDSPIRRRAGSGEVTKFRMAATDRYFDSAAGQWVDGDTFYVDVDAWNALGASVSASVFKGDPVVVVGKIATSEYEVDGAKRSRPVIKAAAVGHDLSRGSAVFKRTPRATADPVPAADEPSHVVTEDGEQVDARTGELADAAAAPF
ncbi:single-strand DNA-binding protein [Klenkia soli]|uniref:Single-strand DNA-binding protein n=1 Tax=Klenkia soli TaxID=1052260 RepID=A0A1H0KI45_9ACTN|nr:single-stranded DNA-binding protein [Klenkia soli]SDO55619.1 single-strand DNA-binding protein [Klenkia soli]